MTIDQSVPIDLLSLQRWVGSVITSPIDAWEKEEEIPILSKDQKSEADILVSPGPILSSSQRIAIYRQQYWFRLLNVLQNVCPGTLRLFGYEEFNEMLGVPYLLSYPPSNWNLDNLSKRFDIWLEDAYQMDDKEIVLPMIKADIKFDSIFSAEMYTSIHPSEVSSHPIFLQPTVHVLKASYDVLSFREKLLDKEVEYFENHDFPKASWDKIYYFVIYRNSLSILYKEIELGQYLVLKAFEMGAHLEDALSVIFGLPEKERKHAEENIQKWFEAYVQNNWLTMQRK